MKIFISADLEGINGVAAPEDVEETGSGYQQARVFMTEEVNAVVSGAFAGGATKSSFAILTMSQPTSK